jgi:hypothetical protein
VSSGGGGVSVGVSSCIPGRDGGRATAAARRITRISSQLGSGPRSGRHTGPGCTGVELVVHVVTRCRRALRLHEPPGTGSCCSRRVAAVALSSQGSRTAARTLVLPHPGTGVTVPCRASTATGVPRRPRRAVGSSNGQGARSCSQLPLPRALGRELPSPLPGSCRSRRTPPEVAGDVGHLGVVINTVSQRVILTVCVAARSADAPATPVTAAGHRRPAVAATARTFATPSSSPVG